jgi:hypothetical protein
MCVPCHSVLFEAQHFAAEAEVLVENPASIIILRRLKKVKSKEPYKGQWQRVLGS